MVMALETVEGYKTEDWGDFMDEGKSRDEVEARRVWWS